MPPIPTIVYGVISVSGTVQSGVVVTLTNQTHAGTDTRTTNINGQYLFDDMPDGYIDGDSIKISYSGGYAIIDSVSIGSTVEQNISVSLSGIFNVFDHTESIVKVLVTPGYTDTDGSWIPESYIEYSIPGHVSDMTLKELKFISPVIVKAGVRKLAIPQTVGLDVGHRIKITEIDETTESEWLVYKKAHAPGMIESLIGINRETFVLRRRT